MLRKLTILGSSVLPFLWPINVFAQAATATPTPNPATDIMIAKPSKGFASLGDAVSNILTFAFAIAILVVLVMLIWGAFEWITSGGDKEAVGHARNRILNALIGLAVLAIAYALARVAAQFLGFDIGNITIPTPNRGAVGL